MMNQENTLERGWKEQDTDEKNQGRAGNTERKENMQIKDLKSARNKYKSKMRHFHEEKKSKVRAHEIINLIMLHNASHIN